jgi:quercetin dioxygenase-like cupin family protein
MKAGIYPAPLGNVGISVVDIQDIAEATAIVLTSAEHNGKTYNLNGPEALSGPKAALIWSKLLGTLRGSRHGCVRGADEEVGSVVVGIRHPYDVSRVSRTWFRRGDGRCREVDETPGARAPPLRRFCRGNRRPLEVVNRVKHSTQDLEENKMSSVLPTIPPDDPKRSLTIAQPENLPHIGLVGDTYTITVTGEQTAGRFCVIDMHIPPGGGPPPHRHDFEETFILLEGQMEATFRGKKSTVRAGETLNIPANAPHQFQNVSGEAVRMLCICSPAGQEKFFLEVGVPVATRTTPPPKLSEKEQAAFIEKVKALAPKYRTELLREA